MKTNDPRLTAFVLGELNAEESRVVQRALQNEPSIASEVAAIEDMVKLMNASYQQEEPKLNAEQRGKIFTAGKEATPADNVIPLRSRSWVPWAGVGVAAAAAVAVMTQFTPPNGNAGSSSTFASIPATDLSRGVAIHNGPWEISDGIITTDDTETPINPSAEALSQQAKEWRQYLAKHANEITPPQSQSYQEAAWIDASTQTTVSLPLTSGNLSWQWVKQAIDKRQPVPSGIIRAEEIVNANPVPFSSDISLKGVTASVGLVDSPWDQNSVIAVIHVSNPTAKSVNQVSAGIIVSPEVKQFRIIGYSNATGSSLIAPDRLTLEPGYSHTVLCELDLADRSQELDKLITFNLATGGELKSSKYSLSPASSIQPSPSAQFSVALAYWAQWAGNSKTTTGNNASSVKLYLEEAASQIEDKKAKQMAAKILSIL